MKEPKGSIFCWIYRELIKVVESYPSFTHQIDGLYKFNIVYSEDFSLVFFNSAKSFNRVVEIGIVLFDASVLLLDICHSVLAFELDGFNTC